MTTILAMILAVLLLIIGVALLAFDIFARVFNSAYNKMFAPRPPPSKSRYGSAILAVAILLYFIVKSGLAHH